MEDHAAERAERARGVLMLTAVGTDNILASSNIGGPEVSMGSLTSSASDW